VYFYIQFFSALFCSSAASTVILVQIWGGDNGVTNGEARDAIGLKNRKKLPYNFDKIQKISNVTLPPPIFE
jgi:hypothetical protein